MKKLNYFIPRKDQIPFLMRFLANLTTLFSIWAFFYLLIILFS